MNWLLHMSVKVDGIYLPYNKQSTRFPWHDFVRWRGPKLGASSTICYRERAGHLSLRVLHKV